MQALPRDLLGPRCAWQAEKDTLLRGRDILLAEVERLHDAVAAVNEHRNELLDTIDDPTTWGPAKRFAAEAAEAGIELTDTEAVQRLIDEINQRGGLSAP